MIDRWLWGLAWATVVFTFASSRPLLQLENGVQARLWQQLPSLEAHEDVVIIGIDGQLEVGGQGADFSLERSNYAALVHRLLGEAGARVVVLNLPGSFVVPQKVGNEDLDAPLRQVVQVYAGRLVLATRATLSLGQPELTIYNHFLPFSSLQLSYLVPPDTVQGFVQDRTDALGVLRQAWLEASLIRRDSRTSQVFASAEALAVSRYGAPYYYHRSGLWFAPNYDAVPIIPIEHICPPRISNSCLAPVRDAALEPLRGRIVLVGFVGGYPETFPMTLADGRSRSAVEIQAQVISSLLQDNRYQPLPRLAVWLVLVLVSLASTWGGRQRLVWLGIIWVLYGAWAVVQLAYGGWLWPLALPWLASVGTAVSVSVMAVLAQNRRRLQQQQAELEALRQAEREAVIQQARKLLYRVATDIHDRELQDLKVVMDDLELLQLDLPQTHHRSIDRMIQTLAAVGTGVRQQLNDVRLLAGKLGVSPRLRGGLAEGIRQYVQELQTSQTLILPIAIDDLQPSMSPKAVTGLMLAKISSAFAARRSRM
ncbi:MAG: CHASE2 domain-containing protein [Synechococcaceae cyanobacterium SM2_3_60]|nr:CHASE2 domain-containing protein [Synechococcaceae cyanobacterium SM2_3_60]